MSGEDRVIRYLKGNFLGKGGFAKCYAVKNLETKETWAAKVMSKARLTKERMKAKLMSEIRIHKSMDHKKVVSFQHFFEDKENVYILLELCENQTLSELLKNRKSLLEIEARCYTKQICEGL